MRADDGVGAVYVVFDGRQMHRAALAPHQSDVPEHQFAEHAFHRSAARQRIGVSAIGAERLVALAHGDANPAATASCPRERWLVPLIQILQKEIVCPLLAIADLDLETEQLQSLLGSNVVVARRI